MLLNRLIKYIVILISFSFICLSFKLIQPYPITKDARDNSTAAYHLWKSGEIKDERNKLTNEREPLPIFLTAWHVKLFTSISKTISIDEFNNTPEVTVQILKINSIFASLSIISMLLVCRLIGLSWLSTGVVACGSWFYFILTTDYLCNLYTEILASLIILLIAVCSILQFRKGDYLKSILIGFLMGLFTLTKASGLYISIATITFYTFSYAISNKGWGVIIRYQILTLITLILVVSPWMYRNYVLFDDFAVAQRGGIVLLTRAIKNDMSNIELKGAFYVYAPDSLKIEMEKVFGYKKADLALNGKYTRLIRRRGNDWYAEIKGKPELAVSFFSKAHAIQQKFRMMSFRNGITMADSEKYLRSYAVDKIKNSPIQHLKTIPVFAWRGIWSFNGNHWLINFLSFIALILLPVVGVFRKNAVIIGLAGFSLMTFIFYASVTHFISRYSAPLIPISLICLLYWMEMGVGFFKLKLHKLIKFQSC